MLENMGKDYSRIRQLFLGDVEGLQGGGLTEQPAQDLSKPVTECGRVAGEASLEFGEGKEVHAFDFFGVEAERLKVEDAAVEEADFVVVGSVVHFEFDERLKFESAHAEFLCQPAHCRLEVGFSRLDMFGDGAVEGEGGMGAGAAALLNEQSAVPVEEQDVNAAMPKSLGMGNRTRRLVKDNVLFGHNIEQFVGHGLIIGQFSAARRKAGEENWFQRTFPLFRVFFS